MTAKITASSLAPGMVITLDKEVMRVESSVRLSLGKGVAVMKTRLRAVDSGEIIEKNFKVDEEIEEIPLIEKKFEYLYPEQGKHLFLDIESLRLIQIPSNVIGEKVDYLKEGVSVSARLYGELIHDVELPQFLELMVAKVEERAPDAAGSITQHENVAFLETGAEVFVPSYVNAGDVIKVDTQSREFVQRV